MHACVTYLKYLLLHIHSYFHIDNTLGTSKVPYIIWFQQIIVSWSDSTFADNLVMQVDNSVACLWRASFSLSILSSLSVSVDNSHRWNPSESHWIVPEVHHVHAPKQRTKLFGHIATQPLTDSKAESYPNRDSLWLDILSIFSVFSK